MYWCDNCKAFHEDEMIKYIEEAHGEVFKVCGHCGSEEIEPADKCPAKDCDKWKKETDDYCEWCTPKLNAIAMKAISDFEAVIGKTFSEPKEELIRWLEYEI